MSKRVLIVKLSSLGDLFHALPAVHAIKQGMNVAIDWVTQPEYAGLVACFTDVERVITFPRNGFLRHAGTFAGDLRAERYDLALDLQGLMKSALTARLARADARIGPVVCREGAGMFYTMRPPRLDQEQRAHAVEEGLQIARYLGVERGPAVFPLCFPEVAPIGASPRIGIVPGSRWPSKNWPAVSFESLIKALADRVGGSIFLFGGDSDRSVCGLLAEAASREGVHDLSGRLDLVQLGSLMQTLNLVISNDTGPMHMAAALGVPVVGLFGPTDPNRTGPWGAGHQVLQTQPLPDCAPCYRRQCPSGGTSCLSGIPVETVLAAAQRVLKPCEALAKPPADDTEVVPPFESGL